MPSLWASDGPENMMFWAGIWIRGRDLRWIHSSVVMTDRRKNVSHGVRHTAVLRTVVFTHSCVRSDRMRWKQSVLCGVSHFCQMCPQHVYFHKLQPSLLFSHSLCHHWSSLVVAGVSFILMTCTNLPRLVEIIQIFICFFSLLEKIVIYFKKKLQR